MYLCQWPHDLSCSTLFGQIQYGGFIRALLLSIWTLITWQITHSRSNISMPEYDKISGRLYKKGIWRVSEGIKDPLKFLMVLNDPKRPKDIESFCFAAEKFPLSGQGVEAPQPKKSRWISSRKRNFQIRDNI